MCFTGIVAVQRKQNFLIVHRSIWAQLRSQHFLNDQKLKANLSEPSMRNY